MRIGWESTKRVGEICRQEKYLDFWWPMWPLQVVCLCWGLGHGDEEVRGIGDNVMGGGTKRMGGWLTCTLGAQCGLLLCCDGGF